MDSDKRFEIQKIIEKKGNIEEANAELAEKCLIDITKITVVDTRAYIYNCEDVNIFNRHIKCEANHLMLDNFANVISASFRKPSTNIAHVNWEHVRAEMHYDGVRITIFKHDGKFFIMPWGKYRQYVNYEGSVKEILEKRHFPWYAPFEYEEGKHCYTFELIGPNLRNITKYPVPNLILLSIFNKQYSFEYGANYVDSFAKANSMSRPKQYPINNENNIKGILARLDFLDKGLILRNHNNSRIKVKNPNYRMIENFRDPSYNRGTLEKLAKIVLSGHAVHVAEICKEYSDLLILLDNTMDNIIREAEAIWSSTYTAQSRKEFAHMMSTRIHVSPILFARYKGKISNFNKDKVGQYISTDYLIDRARLNSLKNWGIFMARNENPAKKATVAS